MPNLVLLAGVPGAGKSTWAKTFLDLKYAMVSSDDIRKRLAGSLRDAHENQVKPWDVFYQEISDRLTHGIDVVADATFLTRRHRDRAGDLARQTGASLHLVLFKNWMAAHARNEARDDDTKVPTEAMEGMMLLFWDTLVDVPKETYDSVTYIETFNCPAPPT